MMLAGNIAEARENNQKIDVNYFINIIGLSFATGFLSGGVQHYLDNPVYASFLLGIGLIVSYVTFFRRDQSEQKITHIALVAAISLVLMFSGYLLTSGLLDSIHIEATGAHDH
jgi:uncharacterized membrane protein